MPLRRKSKCFENKLQPFFQKLQALISTSKIVLYKHRALSRESLQARFYQAQRLYEETENKVKAFVNFPRKGFSAFNQTLIARRECCTDPATFQALQGFCSIGCIADTMLAGATKSQAAQSQLLGGTMVLERPKRSPIHSRSPSGSWARLCPGSESSPPRNRQAVQGLPPSQIAFP